MGAPSLSYEKAFLHTASPPSKQARVTLENLEDESDFADPVAREQASSTLHLVDLADGKHTLCGLPLSRVLTGGYCEQLDGKIDDPQFERTIFARDGREAESCEICLSLHPSVLAVSMLEDL